MTAFEDCWFIGSGIEPGTPTKYLYNDSCNEFLNRKFNILGTGLRHDEKTAGSSNLAQNALCERRHALVVTTKGKNNNRPWTIAYNNSMYQSLEVSKLIFARYKQSCGTN